MEVTALFDGDVVAYRAGFAAEKRYYYDARKPPESGGPTWDTKKEALYEIEEQYLEHDRDLEPLENALQNAKSLIANSLEAIKSKYTDSTVDYVTFVSGNQKKPNFRKEVAPQYKAHRKAEPRPTYLKDILKYLVDNHAGFSTEGCEADDFFGHAANDARKEGKVPVIVSVDKDLKQLAGMHLNLVSRKFEDVSEDYARLFFWRQMLQGDSADNIKGITGIGEVKSRRYIPDGIHDSKAQKIVSSFYKKEYEEDWRETYNRNAKLLWIWRKIPDDCPHTLEEKQEVFHSTV